MTKKDVIKEQVTPLVEKWTKYIEERWCSIVYVRVLWKYLQFYYSKDWKDEVPEWFEYVWAIHQGKRLPKLWGFQIDVTDYIPEFRPIAKQKKAYLGLTTKVEFIDSLVDDEFNKVKFLEIGGILPTNDGSEESSWGAGV